jgi:uncharacterized membrane protein
MLMWLVVTTVFALIAFPILDSAFPSSHCSSACTIKRNLFSSFLWLIFSVLVGIPLASSSFKAVFLAMRTNTHVSFAQFFSSFSRPYYVRLLKLGFVLTVLHSILAILIFPGIYFSLVTIFVLPLHLEHTHLNIKKSIKFSLKIVHRYFCHFLGFVLLLLLLQVLGFFALLVGLFITLPLAHTSTCYAYHHLIGVNEVPLLIPRSASYVMAPVAAPPAQAVPAAQAHEYI